MLKIKLCNKQQRQLQTFFTSFSFLFFILAVSFCKQSFAFISFKSSSFCFSHLYFLGCHKLQLLQRDLCLKLPLSQSRVRQKLKSEKTMSSKTQFCFLNLRTYLIYLCCYLLVVVAAGSRVVNGLKCYCNPKECDVIRSLDCPGKGLIVLDPCK